MIAQENLKRVSRYAPAIYSVDDLRSADFPSPTYLVDGLLTFGSATILTGREKSGKSLLILYLAYCIANGVPFLDRSVMEGPVLYCVLEDNMATVRHRLSKIDGGQGEYPLFLARLDGSLDGQDFQVEHPQDIAGLIELIDEIKPVLVIIDPLREAHSGRENDSDDMAPRIRPIRQIAHQTNTTIIVTHHAGKMSGSFRGSTAIRAAFDDEILFTRDDEDSSQDMRGSIRAEGRNLQKTVETIAFDSTTFHWVVTNAPAISLDPTIRHKIVELLEVSGEWLTADEIANQTGSSLRSVQNRISSMLRENPVSIIASGQAKKGKPRRYQTPQQSLDLHSESSSNIVHLNGVSDEVSGEQYVEERY